MAKHRSPAYPQADLKTVVELLEKLYPEATKHALGVDTVASEWGYKSLASASPYIAAAKQFGLLEEVKGSSDRMVRMSSWGVDVSSDPEEETAERRAALKLAAVFPKAFKDMWDKWEAELPPESEIRRFLTRDRDFNPKHVARVASNYRNTLEFAKLIGNGRVDIGKSQEKPADETVDSSKNGNDLDPLVAGEVKVGAHVQWTSQGQQRFPKPLPVDKIVEGPDGAMYAYVGGNEKGAVPVSQLTVADAPVSETQVELLDPNAFAHVHNDPPSSGPEVRFPLPGKNELVLTLKKPVSEADFERITQLLELSKESLVGEDDDE